MARDQQVVSCLPNEWTQLTNSDAVDITFQVISASVKVRATTDTTAPAADAGGYEYHTDIGRIRGGELNVSIASLAHGAGMVRLWARPIDGRRALVVVDHV